MLSKIRVKNWPQFQHFKDRCPPWIKLYRDLLDDPDWCDLDGEAAKILVMLWLVASEDCNKEGRLPDLRKLAFRLRMKEDELNQHIQELRHWLIFDDINMISPRYQSDAPETETEGERENCAKNCATENHPKTENHDSYETVKTYTSAKGKILQGETLTSFDQFWNTFDYKKDRARSADAFIKVYSKEILPDIIDGARRTASDRQAFLDKGLTPIYAEGWLTGRRWEDENAPANIGGQSSTEEEWA